MITSEIRNSVTGGNILIVKAVLDHDFFEALNRGEYSGLGDRIADKIAENLMPEMEQRILADPTFKDRIIGDILVRLSNKIASKKFPKKSEVRKEKI